MRLTPAIPTSEGLNLRRLTVYVWRRSARRTSHLDNMIPTLPRLFSMLCTSALVSLENIVEAHYVQLDQCETKYIRLSPLHLY